MFPENQWDFVDNMSVEFTDVNDSKMIDENLNRAKSMQ